MYLKISAIKNLVFFAFLTGIVAACTKPKFENPDCVSNCYILEGTLIDTPYNQPVADAEVNLRYWKGQWNYWIASAKTDANGYWKMSFDGNYFDKKSELVSLKFEKNGFLETGQNFELDTSMIDVVLVKNEKVYREAHLAVRISTAPDKYFTDFEVDMHYDYTHYLSSLKGPGVIDTVIQFITAADMPTSIKCFTTGGDFYGEIQTITVPYGVHPTIAFIFE